MKTRKKKNKKEEKKEQKKEQKRVTRKDGEKDKMAKTDAVSDLADGCTLKVPFEIMT